MADPDCSLISSKGVFGTDFRGARGREVGTIGKRSGKAAFGLMGFGGSSASVTSTARCLGAR